MPYPASGDEEPRQTMTHGMLRASLAMTRARQTAPVGATGTPSATMPADLHTRTGRGCNIRPCPRRHAQIEAMDAPFANHPPHASPRCCIAGGGPAGLVLGLLLA